MTHLLNVHESPADMIRPTGTYASRHPLSHIEKSKEKPQLNRMSVSDHLSRIDETSSALQKTTVLADDNQPDPTVPSRKIAEPLVPSSHPLNMPLSQGFVPHVSDTAGCELPISVVSSS